jgi:hypothetical protein
LWKATDFEARDDKTYSVEITANRAGTNGGANEHTTKTITVTVTDLDDEASKGFIKTPSAVASGDGNTLTSSSCEGMLGSEFVIIDDFHFCRSRVIGFDMTENRIFTLCRMIT